MAKHDVKFDYFHGYESEQFAFYRIPKVLFTDDYFKDLSSDAKVLYGLMLDRMSLSIKNTSIWEISAHRNSKILARIVNVRSKQAIQTIVTSIYLFSKPIELSSISYLIITIGILGKIMFIERTTNRANTFYKLMRVTQRSICIGINNV